MKDKYTFGGGEMSRTEGNVLGFIGVTLVASILALIVYSVITF